MPLNIPVPARPILVEPGKEIAEPPVDVALRQRAAALTMSGRHADAARGWQQVLRAAPRDIEAAAQLGAALFATSHHAEAMDAFERALSYAPDFIEARIGAARALLALGRTSEARHRFEDILATRPDVPEAIAGLAEALRKASMPDRGLQTLERGLALLPDHDALLYEKALALSDLNRQTEAIPLLEGLRARRPEDEEVAVALAVCLRSQERWHEARPILHWLTKVRSTNPTTWFDYGAACRAAGDYGEAAVAFRRSLALKPASVAAYCNLSQVLYDLEQFEESRAAAESALAIEPESHVMRFSKSVLHLTLGEWEQGWEEYERRFAKPETRGAREDVLAAPWTGEPVAGKSFIVLAEQANGDLIQFFRYVRALAAMGARVTYFVPQRLVRLFAGTADVDVIWQLKSDRRYDYQCHLMSLPHRFTRLGLPIPDAPYMAAEPAVTEMWRDKIGAEGFRVGIAWQGADLPGRMGERSFRLRDAVPLATIDGVRLISLQIGKGTDQLATLPAGMQVEQLGDQFDQGPDGFVDAAGAMAALDLVVTCDTSLAHLAGALGRPVWIALIKLAEWRWQRGSDRSIWYPSARLFRQRSERDWGPVFADMAAALAEHVRDRRSR